MNVVGIVQARSGSQRFPAKVVADLCGRPMLAHVLERAQEVVGIDRVVLAIPEKDAGTLGHLWPHVFAGDEHDVLGRYAEAAEAYGADVVVRITGDCPMLAPDLIDMALKKYRELPVEIQYLALCQPYSQVADGWDAEIFSIGLLREADQKARKSEREHVTTWIRSHELGVGYRVDPEFAELKCSVDTKEDLERVFRIMGHLTDRTDFGHLATWHAWRKAGRP